MTAIELNCIEMAIPEIIFVSLTLIGAGPINKIFVQRVQNSHITKQL